MDSDSDASMLDALSDSGDDFMDSEDEVMVFPKKKGAGKAVLAPKENTMNASKATTAKPSGKGKGNSKTVEEIYQKKTQLEHILLRPDTYSKYERRG
jgi:hypothetical protein